MDVEEGSNRRSLETRDKGLDRTDVFKMYIFEGGSTKFKIEILKYDKSTGYVTSISGDSFGADGQRRRNLQTNSTVEHMFDSDFESLHLIVTALKDDLHFEALVQNPAGSKQRKNLLTFLLVLQIISLLACIVLVPVAIFAAKYYI